MSSIKVCSIACFLGTYCLHGLIGWHEEEQPDCKTPLVRTSISFRESILKFDIKHRRLTRDMRRELVKCLRTVALLAIFSQDTSTVSNVQSCLKSMSVMEPDLILHSILERAVPSLESLVEVRRCFDWICD
jgi:proteasome activator subunit 4